MALIANRYKVLGAGIFSLVLVLGVARFAYTAMLPVMQQREHKHFHYASIIVAGSFEFEASASA